jgi:hypothetical protein
MCKCTAAIYADGCLQGESFSDTIRAQLLRRQEEVKRKTDAVASARATALQAQEAAEKDEGKGRAKPAGSAAAGKRSDSEDATRIVHAAKRKRPSMLH